LAMINAMGWGSQGTGGGVRRIHGRGVDDSDFDHVELSVMRGWSETQVVFVADELRDLRENVCEILGSSRKIGASPVSLRNCLQHFIGLGKTLGDGLRFFRCGRSFLGALGFDGRCPTKFATKRDGEHAHVGGF